jgi:hypothetical protein
MNERIKTLFIQAGGGIEEENGNLWTYCEDLDPEKFAQLIVGECVAICRDIDGEDNIDARSGRQDCAVEIRDHFGVTE